MPRLALIPPWLSGAMSQTCPFFSVPRYLCFYHLDRGVWRTAGSHSLDEPPLQFRPRPGAEGSQEEPPPPATQCHTHTQSCWADTGLPHKGTQSQPAAPCSQPHHREEREGGVCGARRGSGGLPSPGQEDPRQPGPWICREKREHCLAGTAETIWVKIRDNKRQ